MVRWNEKWGCYNFVSGHKLTVESFRECLVREIHEELGLIETRDYTIRPEPPVRTVFVAWSESARVETKYTMALFAVNLADNVLQRISSAQEIRWLSLEELRGRKCRDDKPVSEIAAQLLAAAGQLS